MKIRLISGAAVLTSPQVPRYNPDSVTAPADLSTPTVPALGPDAFGAGIGEGIQRAASAVSGIIKDAREKADRTAALTARTSLDQTEVDLLYNPKTGALTTRGKQAFNVDATTLQAYDAKVTEIGGNLATPAQKETFALMAAQRRAEIGKQLQRHISGELQTYADEANKASLESTLNNVSTNYQDPARVEQERKFGLGVIMSDTDAKGLPPEMVKARVASWESSVHKAVIERLAVDNPVKAQEYYDQNADKLLPAEAVKIKAQLKPLAEAQQGLQTANDIFYASDEKLTLADMLKKVHDQFPNSPNVVKHAETELRSLYSARDDARKKEIQDAEDSVYSAVAKVKLAGGVPKRSDVPAEAWAKLAAVAPDKVDKIADEILHDQEHAVDRVRQEQERKERKQEHDALMADRAANKATPERVTTWAMLKLDPTTLGKTNLDALYAKGKINTTQYQDLVTDKLAIKQGKGERADEILSNKAAVDLVLQTVKIDAKKDPERYGKFYEALNGRMVAFERENQRRPKQAEVKDLARGLLGEVSQDRSFWFDKSVRAFEADPTKVVVPPADRTAITQVLRSKKLPVTDDAIRKIYLEKTIRKGGTQ
jgi:hypothetical protein